MLITNEDEELDEVISRVIDEIGQNNKENLEYSVGKYRIFVGNSTYDNLKYMILYNYDEIFGVFNTINKVSYIVIIICLIFGIFMSLLISERNSRPIASLLEKLSKSDNLEVKDYHFIEDRVTEILNENAEIIKLNEERGWILKDNFLNKILTTSQEHKDVIISMAISHGISYDYLYFKLYSLELASNNVNLKDAKGQVIKWAMDMEQMHNLIITPTFINEKVIILINYENDDSSKCQDILYLLSANDNYFKNMRQSKQFNQLNQIVVIYEELDISEEIKANKDLSKEGNHFLFKRWEKAIEDKDYKEAQELTVPLFDDYVLASKSCYFIRARKYAVINIMIYGLEQVRTEYEELDIDNYIDDFRRDPTIPQLKDHISQTLSSLHDANDNLIKSKCGENYISTKPGLFPDILNEMDGEVEFIPYCWNSLWIDLEIPDSAKAGIYPIDVCLPKQELIHTEWFHADCLAEYYNIEVFSKTHWEYIENFIRLAVKRGVNTILTPVFTYPLDTKIGGERTTIQLVDVELSNGKYEFDFTKFHKWIEMCKRLGVEYFEMSHLFTQWGAKFAPKIIVTVDGEKEKYFGWHTSATSKEYIDFLDSFLPRLTDELNTLAIADKTIFHISDEPAISNVDSYMAAKEIVYKHLKEFKIIDALSDYELYKDGVVENPVPTNNSIHDFIDKGVENLWVYYCCAQFEDVANRFIAQPSYRNRILGTQLYKYDIEGFLHWGYNFYRTQYSIKDINPYLINDSGRAFPAGDPFIVYPGKDGQPVESLRLLVLNHALNDLAAMKLLESIEGKEKVLDLIDELANEPITFSSYPRHASYILELRESINKRIKGGLTPTILTINLIVADP